jgi:uncharacterized protein YdaU (DUF1376 family)
MGKPMPFPVWVQDILLSQDYRLMTSAQRGGYVTLMFECWQDSHCSLPADDEQLRLLSMMTRKEWVGAEIVRSRFQVHPEISSRLTHPRVYEIWSQEQDYRAKCSESGKRGNARRWGGDGQAIARQSLPSPTPSPSPTPKDPDSARAIPGTQQTLPVPVAPLSISQQAAVTSLLDHYVAELLAVRGVQTIRPKGKARETARDLLRLDNARDLVSAYVRLDEPALREAGWPFTWIEQRVTRLQRAATGAGDAFEGVRRG